MAKLAFLLRIVLAMSLLAGVAEAEIGTGLHIQLTAGGGDGDGLDPCIDDICLGPDEGCQEGYSDEMPRWAEGELGYPDPPGWYIMCL